MRALWDWIKSLWPFNGGVQGDDDPDGWQASIYDDENK